MTQAIAKVEREQTLSQEDIDLVKKTVAAGATEPEFKLFLYIAQRYNLDPLIKQIWLVKYGTAPAAIFTSRDGFLSIGHRSGQFDGMDTQAVRGDKGQVVGAICRVWRRDMSHPFTVEVSRSEYDTGKGNWSKMPETMIKKVAESQCLRRAFDISGLYDPSEYDPADNFQGQGQGHQNAQETILVEQEPIRPAQPQPAPKPVTPAATGTPKAVPAQTPQQMQAPSGEMATAQQRQGILKLAGNQGMEEVEINRRLKELYASSLDNLARSDAAHFIKVLQGQA